MNAFETAMNCEAYKEAIAAEPRASVEGAAEHVAGCESCAAFLAEMRSLDARIEKALAIDVPPLRMPELPPVDDGKVVSLRPRARPAVSTPAWIGIAAALALAAIVGIQLIGTDPAVEFSLTDEILAHLDHEPGALVVTDVVVSDERLDRVVNPSIGTLDRSVGLITYAQSCIINGKTVPHLVIQGEKGPVTLLLMPDEAIDSAVSFDGESINGVILPVGSGSIAIVGQQDEALGEIEQRVVDSVEWRL